MKIRFIALALALVLLISMTGCSETVGEIAGNVADAAVAELEKQVKKTLQEYKVEIVEVKSAAGNLNDETDSTLQFYCAVLVRSNSDVFPQNAANALGKIFEQSGIESQTGSKVDSALLVNKSITFKHTDFASGNYYLIWAYTSSLTGNLFATESVEGVG